MTGDLAGRSILVVEDQMMVLMSIEAALHDEGCNSTSVGTVEGALALIGHTPFDAAMLDINLHGENSFPIADALAALGIPFIFSTGYGECAGRFVGAHVLRKPYLQGNLVAALRGLLASTPARN